MWCCAPAGWRSRTPAIRTEGTGAEGGRIAVAATNRIDLRRAEVTSNGIEPAAGASVITLAARQIVLNASTVTSLTGDGQPLAGSGEASLLGDVTVISADSVVAGSSSVLISGLQTNLGSDLQLPAERVPRRQPPAARQLRRDRRRPTLQLHPRRPRRPAARAGPAAALGRGGGKW